VFDGKSGQVRIGHQWPFDFGFLTKMDEELPMSVRRENEYGLWQLYETAAKLYSSIHWSCRDKNLRIGDDAQKATHHNFR
jgi:hypothetical protein